MNKEEIIRVLDKKFVSQTEIVSVIKYLIEYIEELELQIGDKNE